MASPIEMFGFDNLFNFGGIISKTLWIFGIIIFAVIGVGAIYLYSKSNKKKANPKLKQVGWWEEIHGEMVPLGLDNVEEITIPRTNLKVFYNKVKDLWLPRFTRGITKELFYVAITPEREIVNFTLKSLSRDRAESELIHDHTDMRWAAENTREFIKRNYRDKSKTWWKEYKEVITIAILIVLITASFLIISWMMSGIVKDIGSVGISLANAVEKLNMCSPQASSGIVPAG